MRVTVSQLATTCDVSVATVSKILNGKGVYREQTRIRVKETAARLGYQTNASARAMVTGRFGCYALVLSPKPSASLLPLGLLESIDAEMSKAGLHLIISRLPDQQLTSEGFVPKILSHMLADGLLINYNIDVPERMSELLASNRIPAVWFNQDRPLDAVLPDDLSGGREAAQRLIAIGHRRIGWLDVNHGLQDVGRHYSHNERRAGVVAALQAVGQSPVDLGRSGGLPVADRVPCTMAALTAPQRPTAMICYSVESAVVVCLAAAHAGLSIPRDLSVIVFADRPALIGSLICDTMVIDSRAAGAAAIGMLDALVAGAVPQPASRIAMIYQAGMTLDPPSI